MSYNKKLESLTLMLLLGLCAIAIPGASSEAVFVYVRAHLGRH